MTSVKEAAGPGREGAGEGAGAAPDPGGPVGPGGLAGWRRRLDRLTGLVRENLIFSIAIVAAVVPRVVAMLGFGPAILFRMDTFDYLWGASHLSPNVINPSGYSLFLWALSPFHSLLLVVAVQHLLGLGIAAMVYAVLRRCGLPAWGATLAAAPVLFDPAQILIEQFVMADLLAMVLMMAAFALLLLRAVPSLWSVLTAGLLMGASAVVRPTTLPLIVLIPAYLLARRVGWRPAGAALAAGALPVVAYMGWFDAAHGSFNMTNSNGLFLWSRTMSFANCTVIKPPADLQALCPSRQPGPRLSRPVPSQRPQPKNYLWNRNTWEWQNQPRQPTSDAAAFTRANNARALRFAVAAITAQPLGYAEVVAKETVQPFFRTNVLRFPVTGRPDTVLLTPGDLEYASASVDAYNGNTPAVQSIVRHRYGTDLRQPFVRWMNEYQRILYLPGPLFGLIMLTGLAGIVVPRRRTAAAFLLWVSAVIIMVLPTAEHEYTYRYVIPAVPLVCMAAALALRRPRAEGTVLTSPAGQPSQPALTSPPPSAATADASRPHRGGHAMHIRALEQR